MNLNIRTAILNNIQTNDKEQLEATIVDAIQNGEEKMLPGLGVLFELIWNEADEPSKESMINHLDSGIKSSIQ